MNTYRAIAIEPGVWAIERLVDGVAVGLLTRRYEDESEAAYAVYELARQESGRELPANDNE